MPNFLIRPISPQDYGAWLPLWNGYNAFYGRLGPTALSSETTAATWARFFDPQEPVHALIAESDGALVGLAHYLFHRSTISIGPVCYLADVFTSESARGQGIATALIKEVYRHAMEASASRVYWQTHQTNLTAQGVYDKIAERSGFIVYRHLL